ncbi:transcriptional regulator swi6 [Tilletia horrida]|nr:transcriptional regulator swi6 [Tilletia horrida]
MTDGGPPSASASASAASNGPSLATGPGPGSSDVSAGPPPFNPYQKHLQPPVSLAHAAAASPSVPAPAAPAGAGSSAAKPSPSPATTVPAGAAPSTAGAPGAATPAGAGGTASSSADVKAAPAVGPMPVASVYLANYSGVPVFEMTVRGIAVMRRRSDGFLNATQILKVAGVEKGRRTKILEKEILNGEHDKVQGGYGKYQGTWIPLSRAQELSMQHNVSHILKPLLLFDPATETAIPNAAPRRRHNPNAPQQSLGRAAANATAPAIVGDSSVASSAAGPSAAGTAWDSNQGGPDGQRGALPTHQPRFLALRSPAPSALGGDFLNAPDSSITTSAGQGASQLTSTPTQPAPEPVGEDVFGPLTTTTAAAAAAKTLPGSAAKRPTGAPELNNDEDGEPAAKKARGQDGSASRSGLLLGPSPVKDLNALHPSAGLLQAASHPRPGASRPTGAAAAAIAAAQVRASAWNAASSSSADAESDNAPGAAHSKLRSAPRYADRPRLPRASDEGERRARELLIHLFVDDGTGMGNGFLAGWNAANPDAEDANGATNAVKTPAEIAAAARAPFVFGAAAVGAVRANAGGAPGAGGAGGVLPPDVAQRKLDELFSLLIRAVGLDGFDEAILSASGSSSASASAVRRRGIDLDIVTDDHGHTVLHWAAALGRLELVSVLMARPPVSASTSAGSPADGDGLATSDKGKQRADAQTPTIQGVSLGGANPNAGNHAGETALQRTVLVVNAWEHGYFPALLRLLAPSLMTRDFRGRTVLHHIALVSGLRGRAASARYYLECILEFAREVYGSKDANSMDLSEDGDATGAGHIGLGLGLGLGAGMGSTSTPVSRKTAATPAATPAAPHSSSSAPLLPAYVLENLVDAQDEDGETALGIVARLGNAGLVKLLLDAGARKDLPNLLGIRPSDWGFEMVGLGANGADTSMDSAGGDADATRVAVGNELAATRPQDIMAAFGSQAKRTPMKSSDILESISNSLNELTSTYTSELADKNAALEAVQGLLKQATRELANRRRDVSDAQSRADAREETLQRLSNLVGVLTHLKVGPAEEKEVAEKWRPRKRSRAAAPSADGDVLMSDGDAVAGGRGIGPESPISLLADLPRAQAPNAPRANKVEAVVRSKFVLGLLERECATLQRAIHEIDTAQENKEAQYRRLVSICSGVPERNVVEMLDELVLAIESDGADVDLDRLAGFLDKIQPRAMARGSGPGTTIASAGGGAPSTLAARADANGQ